MTALFLWLCFPFLLFAAATLLKQHGPKLRELGHSLATRYQPPQKPVDPPPRERKQVWSQMPVTHHWVQHDIDVTALESIGGAHGNWRSEVPARSSSPLDRPAY